MTELILSIVAAIAALCLFIRGWSRNRKRAAKAPLMLPLTWRGFESLDGESIVCDRRGELSSDVHLPSTLNDGR